MKKKLYVNISIAMLIVCSGLLIYSQYYNYHRDKWLHFYDSTITELIEANRFEDAISEGEIALVKAQTEFGQDDLLCGLANERLAEAKLSLNRKQDALQHLMNASKIYSKYAGQSTNNINIYEKIGDVQCELGNFSIGKEFYKKALQMMNEWQLRQEDKENLLRKIEILS